MRASGSGTEPNRAPQGAAPEQGSASVVVVFVAALLMGLGGVAVMLGEVAASRATASSAADLAALAAAGRWDAGTASACSAARRVARLNGASLHACAMDGADVQVEVRAPGPRVLRRLARMLGRPAPQLLVVARAGPVESRDRG